MTAQELVNQLGADLIGREVLTVAIGEWPGGFATVTEIEPDPAAPEIVFQVRSEEHGEMGVFGHEPIAHVTGKAPTP